MSSGVHGMILTSGHDMQPHRVVAESLRLACLHGAGNTQAQTFCQQNGVHHAHPQPPGAIQAQQPQTAAMPEQLHMLRAGCSQADAQPMYTWK